MYKDEDEDEKKKTTLTPRGCLSKSDEDKNSLRLTCILFLVTLLWSYAALRCRNSNDSLEIIS